MTISAILTYKEDLTGVPLCWLLKIPFKTKQLLKRRKEISSFKADTEMENSILESRQASMTERIAKLWGILVYKEITSKEAIL